MKGKKNELGGLAVKVKMALGLCCAWFQVISFVSFITLRTTGTIGYYSGLP